MINIPTTVREVTVALENEIKDMPAIAKLFYLKEKLLKLEATKTTGTAQFMVKLCTIRVCKETIEELNNASNILV